MRLTDKELEIMKLLWVSDEPMTATEIIKASENRTWREGSIYVLMNTLVKKKAVILKCYKPTSSNAARAYEPIVSAEEYLVANIGNLIDTGVHVDITKLIKHIKSTFKK